MNDAPAPLIDTIYLPVDIIRQISTLSPDVMLDECLRRWLVRSAELYLSSQMHEDKPFTQIRTVELQELRRQAFLAVELLSYYSQPWWWRVKCQVTQTLRRMGW